MTEVILAKLGEMVLKGLNRYVFDDALMKNIRRRMKKYGEFDVQQRQSTIYIEPAGEADIEGAFREAGRIFGIVTLARAGKCEKTMEDLRRVVEEYIVPRLDGVETFKVEAKRSDKKFPRKSPEIMREAGGWILEKRPRLKVDVHEPEATVYVEIRDFAAYVHVGKTQGAGGLPIGTGAGRATLLLSGGIDSPVAGYMIAKRGIELSAVHFFSYPYTSMRAKEKVIELARLLCGYCGRIHLYIVPFTEIQTEIKKKCPEDYFTLVMRRYMMKIACKIAEQNGSLALITGESVGQVASQTVHALAVTDAVCTMPVFRPCIGLDKEEIVKIARKIGTFDTSILPYEDCCTVFTPKHPMTKPQLPRVEEAEAGLDEKTLIDAAIEGVEVIKLTI